MESAFCNCINLKKKKLSEKAKIFEKLFDRIWYLFLKKSTKIKLNYVYTNLNLVGIIKLNRNLLPRDS